MHPSFVDFKMLAKERWQCLKRRSQWYYDDDRAEDDKF